MVQNMIYRFCKLWFDLALWKQILIALILGIFTGLALGNEAIHLAPIGTLFIHAIQMLVVPVVSVAIICAIISLKNFNRIGKIFGKSLLLYVGSMLAATLIGILVAHSLQVGQGLTIPSNDEITAIKQISLSKALVSFIPTSPVAAFAENNVMQIMCFSFLFGIALKMVGEKAKPVQDFFVALSSVVFQFAKIIMSFAPYGIFALIAVVFGQFGLTAIWPLIKFIAAIYLSDLILIGIVFSTVLLIFGISLKHFFGSITSPLITAYTTSSSAATLPITMRTARENLKIDPDLAGFLVPLGTSLNMNGVAIYLSVATVFAANIYGIELHFSQYLTLIITIILSSMGTAAIPGSALVVMTGAMSAVGVPLGALPLIAGVDRFNDMAQTATNVTADLFGATIIAKSEGSLNQEKNPPISEDTKILEPIH